MAAAAAGVTLVIALFFAPRGYQAGFVDMAHDGYQLRQVLDLSQGGVIFRDTFDQYGAGSGYLNALGFAALGRRLLSVKYFICGWYAAIAVLMFVFARQWLDPLLAGFSVLVWVGMAPFYQHGIMISPHVYVLFFQAIAAIVAIRTPALDARRFAVVGVLTGLSWTMKQSIGVLFLGAVLAYLATQAVVERRRGGSRAALAAAAATVAGFVAVVAAVLALLAANGALADWYRQTVVFPREFYLVQYGARLSAERPSGIVSRAVSPVLFEFVRLQLAQPLYWLILRVVVLVAAVAQLCTGVADRRMAFAASVTAFLWLGAFPSANFMHQWWTASLTIPPFVWCMRQLAGRVAREPVLCFAGTIALVLVVVGAALLDRRFATSFRASALTETMVDPPILRGIRTDKPMKRAFETIYGVVSRYRSRHPDARIVAVDVSDGFWSGINESLLFLSAFEGNSHPHPVYWNLPVLSTTVYPDYAGQVARRIADEHPLLIEHHEGRYTPAPAHGYVLLAAVQSDFGFWYVYAPEHADRIAHGEQSTFVARDGSIDNGFAERGAAPAIDSGLNPDAAGAARGTTSSDGAARRVYTWPADAALRVFDGPLEPVAAPTFRAGIVREQDPGAWSVDGRAAGRFSFLLDFPEQDLPAGAVLLARGQVDEGGFQLGFIQDNQWVAFVTVTEAGPFEATLAVQRAGRYRLELANCIDATFWQTARRHWARAPLGLLTGGYMPNRFTIRQLGWTRIQ